MNIGYVNDSTEPFPGVAILMKVESFLDSQPGVVTEAKFVKLPEPSH